MPSLIERIAIIGTGLIGGSLGLAMKRARPSLTIVGHDGADMLDAALIVGAIDEPALSLAQGVSDADLVVIATPLAAALSVLEDIKDALRPGALITDVGSVKRPIVERAANVLPSEVVFVGGHPMAGSSAGGVAHSDAMLFENAVYVLCPVGREIPEQFEPATHLLEEIGARILVLDAETHDRVAAAVSHLPQLLAVALVEAAYAVGGDASLVQTLAAGGFRDMTRIADSPFELWRGILAANHGNVLDALSAVSSVVQRIRNRIIEEDYDAIGDIFTEATERRREIPRDMRGFLQPLHNVVVHAADRPGVLRELSGALADADINIKDIELLKIREGTGGAFRVGFSSASDAALAAERLTQHGFSARRS